MLSRRRGYRPNAGPCAGNPEAKHEERREPEEPQFGGFCHWLPRRLKSPSGERCEKFYALAVCREAVEEPVGRNDHGEINEDSAGRGKLAASVEYARCNRRGRNGEHNRMCHAAMHLKQACVMLPKQPPNGIQVGRRSGEGCGNNQGTPAVRWS